MSDLTIQCQWRSAVTSEGLYCFPDRFTAAFRQAFSHPGVYRWRVMQNQGDRTEPVYIGEAEDIVRRIQRVLTPPQVANRGNTNKRLNKIFADFLRGGRKIVLDIADIAPFEINGIRFGRDAMTDRFKRCALENMLLAIAQADPHYELLNAVVDPPEKSLAALQALPPNKLREIVKKYAPKATS